MNEETIPNPVELSPDVEAATALAERLLDNVELVVRGKRGQIRLVLCALLCRGHVLSVEQRFREAIAELELALRISPGSADALERLESVRRQAVGSTQ